MEVPVLAHEAEGRSIGAQEWEVRECRADLPALGVMVPSYATAARLAAQVGSASTRCEHAAAPARAPLHDSRQGDVQHTAWRPASLDEADKPTGIHHLVGEVHRQVASMHRSKPTPRADQAGCRISGCGGSSHRGDTTKESSTPISSVSVVGNADRASAASGAVLDPHHVPDLSVSGYLAGKARVNEPEATAANYLSLQPTEPHERCSKTAQVTQRERSSHAAQAQGIENCRPSNSMDTAPNRFSEKEMQLGTVEGHARVDVAGEIPKCSEAVADRAASENDVVSDASQTDNLLLGCSLADMSVEQRKAVQRMKQQQRECMRQAQHALFMSHATLHSSAQLGVEYNAGNQPSSSSDAQHFFSAEVSESKAWSHAEGPGSLDPHVSIGPTRAWPDTPRGAGADGLLCWDSVRRVPQCTDRAGPLLSTDEAVHAAQMHAEGMASVASSQRLTASFMMAKARCASLETLLNAESEKKQAAEARCLQALDERAQGRQEIDVLQQKLQAMLDAEQQKQLEILKLKAENAQLRRDSCNLASMREKFANAMRATGMIAGAVRAGLDKEQLRPCETGTKAASAALQWLEQRAAQGHGFEYFTPLHSFTDSSVRSQVLFSLDGSAMPNSLDYPMPSSESTESASDGLNERITSISPTEKKVRTSLLDAGCQDKATMSDDTGAERRNEGMHSSTTARAGKDGRLREEATMLRGAAAAPAEHGKLTGGGVTGDTVAALGEQVLVAREARLAAELRVQALQERATNAEERATQAELALKHVGFMLGVLQGSGRAGAVLQCSDALDRAVAAQLGLMPALSHVRAGKEVPQQARLGGARREHGAEGDTPARSPAVWAHDTPSKTDAAVGRGGEEEGERGYRPYRTGEEGRTCTPCRTGERLEVCLERLQALLASIKQIQAGAWQRCSDDALHLMHE
jgi:hypothetical protein